MDEIRVLKTVKVKEVLLAKTHVFSSEKLASNFTKKKSLLIYLIIVVLLNLIAGCKNIVDTEPKSPAAEEKEPNLPKTEEDEQEEAIFHIDLKKIKLVKASKINKKKVAKIKNNTKAKRINIDGTFIDNDYNNSLTTDLVRISNKIYYVETHFIDHETMDFICELRELSDSGCRVILQEKTLISNLYRYENKLYYTLDRTKTFGGTGASGIDLYLYDPLNGKSEMVASDSYIAKITEAGIFYWCYKDGSTGLYFNEYRLPFDKRYQDPNEYTCYIVDNYIYYTTEETYYSDDEITDEYILYRFDLSTEKTERVFDIKELSKLPIPPHEYLGFTIYENNLVLSLLLEDSIKAYVVVLNLDNYQLTILEIPITYDGLCFLGVGNNHIFINAEVALYKYNLTNSNLDLVFLYDDYLDPQTWTFAVFDNKWIYISTFDDDEVTIIFRISQDGKGFTKVSLKE